MKIKAIVSFLFLFSAVICTAQIKKTEFEFTLYGEDAKGHRDSVIIGFHHDVDSLANSPYAPYIDTTFGDKNIAGRKFDSIFEMRVHKFPYLNAHSTNTFEILNTYGVSKRVTLGYKNRHQPDCVPYGVSGNGFLLMKVKYPPVKLSWDKNKFEQSSANYCVGLSYLLYSEYLIQEGTPDKAPYTVFMSKISEIIDSLKDLSFPITLNHIPLRYPDGSIDSLQSNYIFQFVNSNYKFISATESIIKVVTKIYPNPCKGQLNLFMPDINGNFLKVNIININGEIMQVSSIYLNDIISLNTSNLNAGHYIVDVVTRDNIHYIGKFDKIE